MVEKYFLGTAVAVAQVDTIQITADDVATTYEVTIGDDTVSVLGSGTSVDDTATALQVALAASLLPYFKAVTWTVLTDTITATATVPGVPFVAASSVVGGAGTIGVVTSVTLSSGPNHIDDPTNFSDGSIPATGDTLIIKDTAVNILWGLDQNGVDLAELVIEQSFTGVIGLDYKVFTTNGALATDLTAEEYRDVYYKIGSDEVNIGEILGTNIPAGTGRILLDLDTTESKVTVFNTGNSSLEAGRTAVRLKGVNVNNQVFVRSAVGGVGLASEVPFEVSTFDLISISDSTTATRVIIGEGVTFATFEQNGGINLMNSAGTVALVDLKGGTLRTEGDYTITTSNVGNGTLQSNHIKTSGSAHATIIINDGGAVDGRGSNEARTWDSVTLERGSALAADSDHVTITSLKEDSGPYLLEASSV